MKSLVIGLLAAISVLVAIKFLVLFAEINPTMFGWVMVVVGILMASLVVRQVLRYVSPGDEQ